MSSDLKCDFGWLETPRVSDELLSECADLFNSHYGRWGEKGPRPGEQIVLSPQRLRPYLNGKSGRIAFARHKGKLVCYALTVFTEMPNKGRVAWVTQLVTHVDYRRQRVATRVLSAIWGFSDFYAWGLVTANPFAVKALEGATRRRCDPQIIEAESQALLNAGNRLVPYIQDKVMFVNYARSVINTDFYVSHSELDEMIKIASGNELWRLGELYDGQEWFAFTFKMQLMDENLDSVIMTQLADSDDQLVRIFEGMSLDESHKWAKFDAYEADFMVRTLELKTGDTILDLGCGKGRHSMALAGLGLNVTGHDLVHSWIGYAKLQAQQLGLNNVSFKQADARKNGAKASFSAVICVYDVIGSYPEEIDNSKIIERIKNSLKPGGKALISVMNMGKTERQAKHQFKLSENPEALFSLPPSNLMQQSGEVFDANYYMIDKETKIVYRKEQFTLEGQNLPAELIVRDRRYYKSQIVAMCETAGLEVVWARHVRAGKWDEDCGELSDKAKEILLLVSKPK